MIRQRASRGDEGKCATASLFRLNYEALAAKSFAVDAELCWTVLRDIRLRDSENILRHGIGRVQHARLDGESALEFAHAAGTDRLGAVDQQAQR